MKQMTSFGWTLAVFLTLSGPVLAQPTGPPKPAPAEPATSRVKVLSWDFGLLTPGKEARHRYTITNTSATTWTVKSVSKTCACTVGELSARQVKPSETTSLEVVFRAPKDEGSVFQSLMVEFAEAKTPLISLVIKGEVRHLLSVSPPKVDLGRVAVGTEPTRTLELRNYSDQDLTITEIETPDGVRVDQQPAENAQAENRPRQVWKLVVQADPTRLRPNSPSAALVVHTNSKTLDAVRIPVLFQGQALLTAHPSRLTFANIEIGKSAEQTILVEVSPQLGPVTDKDLVLSSQLGDEWELRVVKTTSPQRFLINCQWRPRKSQRRVERELEITIRDKKVTPVRVRIAAEAP